MAGMVLAFEVEAQYGCLVVRDSESVGDVGGWDPETAAWFVDRGSAIFAVRPGIEGLVRCEVWRNRPDVPLSQLLFSAVLDISGSLQVEDPGGIVDARISFLRGARSVTVLVDDPSVASHVQVVVEDASS